MRREGSCLCGALSYEIEGDFDGVWMCHCSNCRKASGGLGTTIVIVPRDRVHWLSGEDHRVTYALRPSYTTTRCKTCRTPLPAEEDEHNVYLTAGTLDDPLGAGIELAAAFARVQRAATAANGRGECATGFTFLAFTEAPAGVVPAEHRAAFSATTEICIRPRSPQSSPRSGRARRVAWPETDAPRP